MTTYRDAGVDIEAKAHLLARLAPVIASTHSDAVAAGHGAFAGAVRLDHGGFVLATVDGVGTKTVLARRGGRDGVVGADIVAHCANDLVCGGARPLAFLDYIAMGRLNPDVVATVMGAMAEACRAHGVALLGGETAEMPDVYAEGAYDVVGTMIGIVPPDGLITGAAVRPGDRVIGLASTGLHTNGYSLARRVVDEAGIDLDDLIPSLGVTAGDALLQPHRAYGPAVFELLARVRLHAIAHITGGGLAENLTRVLPDGCRARLRRAWPEPPVFRWLQRAGAISDVEMERAFNLGVGMVLVAAPHDVSEVIRHLEGRGIPACDIGAIEPGNRGVDLT